MNARILNLIHVLLGILFIAGVAVILCLKGVSGNFREDLTKNTDTAIVLSVFLIGFLAIVVSFAFDRVAVRSLNRVVEETAQSESSNDNGTAQQSSINFEVLKKELDEVISSEVNNEIKSSKALNLLCSKLNAGQGILFRIQNEGGVPKLKMFASYAYASQNGRQEEFDFNDGFVGLAAKEDREVVLDDLPSDKIKISSGLGKSAPVALHIVPVKCLNEMKGVLELSFFAPLDSESKKFLQDNLTKIGAIL